MRGKRMGVFIPIVLIWLLQVVVSVPVETQASENAQSPDGENASINTHYHNFLDVYMSDEKNHWHPCSGCDEQSDIEAHTQGAGIVTKAATEDEEGIRSYSCTECGYVMRTEPIAKLPHNHRYDRTTWKSDAKTHWYECRCGERTASAAHKFAAWTTAKAATKDEEGIRYRVCIGCGYVEEGKIPKVTVLSVPKISALSASGKGVTIRWGKVQNASGYAVYRKQGKGSWKKIAVIKKAGTTSYTDKAAVKNGKAYSYKICAYRSGTKAKGSKMSDAKKIIYLNAPKISGVRNDLEKSATASYSKNAKADGYEICYSTSPEFKGGGTVKKVSSPERTSKTVRGLNVGGKYYIRVRAYAKSGGSRSYSAWSKSRSVKIAKEIPGKIIEKNGYKYFQYGNGKKAQDCFIKVKGKAYYFGKKGIMETGWMKKGGKYYFFDRSTGVQRMDRTVDGIRIKKDGTAENTAYNRKLLETIIEAKTIMNQVTKPTDTKEQKLKKVFDWVLKHPYKRYRRLPEVRKQEGWWIEYANDVYKRGNGCCVSEACAFAFLARECGYKEVYVCDDTGHAWAEINGRVYDTLFAEAKSYKNYYNSDYKTARLHRANKLKF